MSSEKLKRARHIEAASGANIEYTDASIGPCKRRVSKTELTSYKAMKQE